jgi:hypothetical protein
VPSEPHNALYHRLRDITAQVKAVVDTNDLDELPGLVQAHKDVMTDLEKAGFSNDPGLLGLVTEIRDRIQEAMIGIQARQDEIGQQLKATGAKRKLDKAYGM